MCVYKIQNTLHLYMGSVERLVQKCLCEYKYMCSVQRVVQNCLKGAPNLNLAVAGLLSLIKSSLRFRV